MNDEHGVVDALFGGGAPEPEPEYDESNDVEVLADVVADTLSQRMGPAGSST
jgi:hypothetical protein